MTVHKLKLRPRTFRSIKRGVNQIQIADNQTIYAKDNKLRLFSYSPFLHIYTGRFKTLIIIESMRVKGVDTSGNSIIITAEYKPIINIHYASI